MIRILAIIISLTAGAHTAHAGLFDDLTTIVGGHVSDIKSRFKDDQLIEGEIVAQTAFREEDRGQDALHHGSGSVLLVEAEDGRYIQLAPDFDSTPGPDYHVYVSTDTNVDHEDRFDKSKQIELGRLIKGSGASFYKLPEGVEFSSVTIWCKRFGEFITSADFGS